MATWFSNRGIQAEQAEDDVNRAHDLIHSVGKDSCASGERCGDGVQAVHEFQVMLRKYDFNPGSLRVRKGERVKPVMAATDHDHRFKLDDFNINQKIPKGTTVVVEFTADKAGTFQFRCSDVCGVGHRSMKGTLVVEE